MKYLLDTNIIFRILFDNNLYLKYEQQFGLTNKNVFISSISKGELYSIALLRKWDNQKLKILDKFLMKIHFVDINFHQEEIFDIYSRIDVFSRSLEDKGIKTGMGKNDLWISASAVIAGCDLLTADKDFNHLNNHFLQVHYLPAKQS